MMSKILLEISVPASGKKYEILVYDYMKIHRIIELLSQYVSETSHGLYNVDKETILCDSEGGVLNPNISVSEAGIINSTQLILI